MKDAFHEKYGEESNMAKGVNKKNNQTKNEKNSSQKT